MSTQKGRQCRIEVAATYAALALTVTAVSKANPGVIASADHGLAAGAVGYFDTITGMDEMLGQAVSASAVSADSFKAERLDTTNFGDFVSGTFTHVESWLTLSNSTSYEIGGGAADKLDQRERSPGQRVRQARPADERPARVERSRDDEGRAGVTKLNYSTWSISSRIARTSASSPCRAPSARSPSAR